MRASEPKTRRSLKISLFLLSVLPGLLTYTSSAVPQQPGVFIQGGDMITPRTSHTATLLNTGQVLVTGGSGYGGNDGISSAELYDPGKGSFIATGSLRTARKFHTATLLPDGKVLITGGRRISADRDGVASAEIYNPATRTFTPAGNMTVPRAGHTATLLNNGRVLIVGGFYRHASAEVYDPVSGTFTTTGDMNAGIFGSAATLLPEGKVLVSTAYDPGGYGEVYDPLSSVFSNWSTTPRYYFYWHTASLLQNGKVLIAGGGDADNGFDTASAGIYEPDTRSFVTTGRMSQSRLVHAATVLLDRTVLITGGGSYSNFGGLASAELYDSDNGTFTYIGDMNTGRSAHTATALNNGQVLIAGGSPSTMFELYVPRLSVPALIVADVRFDLSSVAAGSSFNVNVSGSNLTPQTFLDVRFSAPGSDSYQVVLNWQKGLEASHGVPAGTAPGMWTINGVRAHEIETDHIGGFNPVSAVITVSP
jgi:Galactose oxidase, central domain